jgi:hypothetical protein
VEDAKQAKANQGEYYCHNSMTSHPTVTLPKKQGWQYRVLFNRVLFGL